MDSLAEPVVVPLDKEMGISSPDNPPASFQEMFARIFAEANLLMCEKQAAYGPGNITAFGERGILVRANDKVERLRNLLFEGGRQTKDESVEDSWRDLLNYAAIALAVRRGWWSKQGCPPLLPERG